MANYDFYLAKSNHSINNPSTGKMGFHFRSNIIQDSQGGEAPFLKLDDSLNDPIAIEIATVYGKTYYTVSVQLVEVARRVPPPSENNVFYETTPLNYHNLVGKVITHVKKADGTIETKDHGGDLLYPDMPEEFPVDE